MASADCIFVVDDDHSARRGLARLVHAAGKNVESFASAKDFLASDSIDRSGCIVLDVRIPEMTGPELQAELVKAGSTTPIIFLSAYTDVETTAEAMKQGAVDFLTKPVDRDDLLDAICVALARDAENRAQKAEHSAIHERINTLTPREHEVMTYVITGMLNKQIAAEQDISEGTVKIHRGRVMRKLQIESVTDLVRLCEKAGIEPN